MTQTSIRRRYIPESEFKAFSDYIKPKVKLVENTKNDYELRRFNYNGVVGIIYAAKNNTFSFVGSAATLWEEFDATHD